MPKQYKILQLKPLTHKKDKTMLNFNGNLPVKKCMAKTTWGNKKYSSGCESGQSRV